MCCAEEMCRQLAQVVEALLATAFAVDLHSTPSSSTSSESSSRQAGSNTAPSLLQQVSMAQVWSQLCTLLRAVRDAIGKVRSQPACTCQGLHLQHNQSLGSSSVYRCTVQQAARQCVCLFLLAARLRPPT
jgi:hypothetical protein